MDLSINKYFEIYCLLFKKNCAFQIYTGGFLDIMAVTYVNKRQTCSETLYIFLAFFSLKSFAYSLKFGVRRSEKAPQTDLVW